MDIFTCGDKVKDVVVKVEINPRLMLPSYTRSVVLGSNARVYFLKQFCATLCTYGESQVAVWKK